MNSQSSWMGIYLWRNWEKVLARFTRVLEAIHCQIFSLFNLQWGFLWLQLMIHNVLIWFLPPLRFLVKVLPKVLKFLLILLWYLVVSKYWQLIVPNLSFLKNHQWSKRFIELWKTQIQFLPPHRIQTQS